MDRHDGGGPRRDPSQDRCGVETQGSRINVREHRLQSDLDGGGRHRAEGQSRDDDLVAALEAEGAIDGLKCGRAAGGADAVLRTVESRKRNARTVACVLGEGNPPQFWLPRTLSRARRPSIRRRANASFEK